MTERVVDKQVTIIVVKFITPGCSTPFIKATVSGIPEPMAPGAMYKQSDADMTTYIKL